ncbi:FMRFamide peptide receptor frpr-18-like [Mercenaria mercenaria]|uniref:FMRFamide peptide receptor frpr-18-like n=1 Tax=Mercenaria mercenaria TaxID=6596 RepID=UPI001E1DEFA4|nr:FMRFamide peptide receptor frpr-18-like [Mercenaria mercenaria]XP_045201890.1 FMRFamide peptide receptor frpr-18-like [Mercenaria mercenaria]
MARNVSLSGDMDNNSALNAYNSTINNNLKEAGNDIALVERYAVPIICTLGLLGNTMSFIVFIQKFLRQKSCSLFLAARSLSDNGFLITLMIMWTSSVFDLRLSRIAGICQIIVFLTYVFGCLSVWLVVFVTTENYIRICKPFMVSSLCQTTKAKYAVIILLICVLCCYNFPLWTMTEECIPNEKHHNFLKIMVYVDSVLTLVAPTAIMVFLMYRIAMSSLSSCKRRRRLSSSSSQRISNLTTKVTTMLLAVTLIFIALNLPLHVVRLRLLIISFIKDQLDISTPLDLIIQCISQLIYYLSLSVNFVIYYLFGSTFRKTFKGLFRGKTKNVYAQTEYSVILSSKARKVGLGSQPATDGGITNNNLLKPNDINGERPLRRVRSSEM